MELLQTASKSWFQLTCLPNGPSLPSATLCGSQLYVIDKNNINSYSCDFSRTNMDLSPSFACALFNDCHFLWTVGDRRWEGGRHTRLCSLHSSVNKWRLGQNWLAVYWKVGVSNSQHISGDQMVVVGGEGALNSVEVCVATS